MDVERRGTPIRARSGREAADASPSSRLVEPRAEGRQTLSLIAERFGLAVETSEDLAEHRRPSWGFLSDEDFQARVAAVFSNPHISCEGAEIAKEACSRFEQALMKEQRRPLLVCSHGTIMSLYLAARLNVGAGDLWRSLGFCETFALDASGELIARLKSG
jgi:broad specificity phosphatase PhoE